MAKKSSFGSYVKSFAAKYNVTAPIFIGTIMAFFLVATDYLGVVAELMATDKKVFWIVAACFMVLAFVYILYGILNMKKEKVYEFDLFQPAFISCLVITLVLSKNLNLLKNTTMIAYLAGIALLFILWVVRIVLFKPDQNIVIDYADRKVKYSFTGYAIEFFHSYNFFVILMVIVAIMLCAIACSKYNLFTSIADGNYTIMTNLYTCASLAAASLLLAIPSKIKYKKMGILDLIVFLLDTAIITLTACAYEHIAWYYLFILWTIGTTLTLVCLLSTCYPTLTERQIKKANEELAKVNANTKKEKEFLVEQNCMEEAIEKSEYEDLIHIVNAELKEEEYDEEDLVEKVNKELDGEEDDTSDIEEDNSVVENIFECEYAEGYAKYGERLDNIDATLDKILTLLENIQKEGVTRVVEVEKEVELKKEEDIVQEQTEEKIDEEIVEESIHEESVEEVTEEPIEEDTEAAVTEEPIEEDTEAAITEEPIKEIFKDEEAEEQIDEPQDEDEDGEETEELQDEGGKTDFEFVDEGENAEQVKAHLSFEMKLRKATDEVKGFYNALKNELCSYGIKARMSHNRENFNKGRVKIARMVINGKTLKLYLACDPMQLDQTYYHHHDASARKSVAHLPTLMNIRSKLAVRKAAEVIASICEDNVIKKKKRYKEQNYVEHLTTDGFTSFELKGYDYLIPEDKRVTMEYAARFDYKFAQACLDYVTIAEKPKRLIVAELTLDQIAENFKDGDVVSLDILRGQLGVQVNADYLKVLESSELNKSITIIANEFTPLSAKMICLAGGKAVAVKYKD